MDARSLSASPESNRGWGNRTHTSDLCNTAPLPGYSPDLMPVEALWRWLREDVTYHHCHATADDLTRRVAVFETQVN